MKKLEEIGMTTRQIHALENKYIYSCEDLVQYFPKRYHDYRKLQLVTETDRFGIFNGELTFCDKRAGKKWYLFLKMRQDDGNVVNILMFSDVYRFKEIAGMLHKRITVCGKPCHDEYGWSIKYPEHVALESEFVPHIEPIYVKVKGISDPAFYEAMKKAISLQEDPLDSRLVSEMNLMDYQTALKAIHLPVDDKQMLVAKNRLMFNDLLYFADSLIHDERKTKSNIHFNHHELFDRFVKELPYELTTDQQTIINKFQSTTTEERFNALIQGDVGCGKTVVAISMIMIAVGSGYQAVLMAPREVLAKQHYEEIKGYADKMGLTCEFLSSSITGKKKNEIANRIASGETQIIVGTHSCIAESVTYHKLGLIVTDEEHLFGVKQKEMLEEKAEEGVHAISMSATPIPRSLAEILYGNRKDIMTIHSMPKGRLPVKTAKQSSHTNVFPFMEKEIRAGRQCYVVCPAIEQNDEYAITSIEEMEAEYKQYFNPRKISMGVVHGKMDAKDVAETIHAFADGKIDILMSTTVIEVGVNVPNTTVMVIEQAERFGLASLHQLRGRVGRSNMQSYCILVSKDRDNERLDTMVRTTDGFEIAEADLKQRGSGDLLGIRQAGNNRFVNEMLKYPLLFQKAIDVVKYCREKGYENHLETIYGENAESVGEDKNNGFESNYY